MIDQAITIPDPLLFDGLEVRDGVKTLPGLRLFPSPGGVQHDEVTAMQDLIELKTSGWLRWFTRR